MNKNKLDFAKKITSVIATRKRKSSFDRSIMHPEREWFSGLLVILTILAVGLYWSVFQYDRYRNVTTTNGSVAEGETVYKDNLVEAALVDFSKRKEAYNNVKVDLLGAPALVTPVVEEVVSESVEVIEEAPTQEAVETPSDIKPELAF